MAHEFIAKKGFISQGNAQVSGSLVVRDGIEGYLYDTASFSVSSSYTTTASFALNISQTDTASLALELSRSDAADYTYPYWLSGKLTGSSPLSIYGNQYFRLNADLSSSDTPPALTVNQADPTSFNLIRGWGEINNFLQLVTRNISPGNYASTDFIAEADNANESSSYIDLGINSSGYFNPDSPLDLPLDGYLYNTNGNLLIGVGTTGKILKFFIGDQTQDNVVATIESDGIHTSGSLIGTASYATTASALNPGATLFVVSGSNGVPAAYLEPYDYSPTSQIYQPPYKAGRIFFDNRYNDWAWYAATGSGATSWSSHLGKEISFTVHNPYSVTLPRLSVVYVGTSSLAGAYYPDVYLAIADGTGQHASVLGVIRNDIPSGSTGFCMTNGVMHRTNMGSFNIGDKLWLSPTVPGGLTTIQPGQPNEQVLVGYCSEAGSLGAFICRQSTYPAPPQAFAGITSDIQITDNDDGTFTLSTGSVNLYPDSTGAGVIIPYALASQTFTFITASTNYIVAEHSASTATYTQTTDASYANGINVVQVAILDMNVSSSLKGDYELHELNVGIVGLALANRTNNKDIALHGIQRQSGLTLFTTGSEGDFGVTAGEIWYGPNQHSLGDFLSSDSASCDTYHYVQSASVWDFFEGVGYDNTHYNDPVLGLLPLGPRSCSANFVYRLATENATDVVILLANEQFDNVIDTVNNVQPPSDLPEIVGTMATLVGLIAFESGSYDSSSVQSAYSTLFAPAVITQHNNLLGLQGGQGGEYYHLTDADYIGTGTGLIVRQFQPTCSVIRHLGATPGHIPYWTDLQTLTMTGSLQVIGGQYVTINSASVNADNPEALLIKQANTTSVNTIGAYSNVPNYSQIYNQNYNSTATASTDIVATADIGNHSSNYIDMGIASSGYNASDWPWVKPLDGYLDMDGGDLWLATLSDNKLLFTFNNTASTNYADKTGFYLSGSFYGTASHATLADNAVFAVTASTLHNANTDIDLNGNIHTNTVYAQLVGSSSYANYSGIAAAATSASWVSASAFITTAQTASYVTSSNVVGKVSSALNADTASLATAVSFVPVAATSASWVSASAFITTAQTASYVTSSNVVGKVSSALNADTASLATAISFVPSAAVSASWVSASVFITTAQTASYVTSSNVVGKVSGALTSDTASSINFVPSAAVSASWVSASAFIITAQTASYVTASNVIGKVSNALNADTASYLLNYAPTVSSSWASASLQSQFATQSLYATSSATASYISSSATWDKQVYTNTASWAQSSSFVTASNVQGAVTTAVTAYSANAINFVPAAAVSASWVSASVFITTAQTASYVTSSNVTGKVSSALNADTASSINFVPNSAATTTQSLFATQSTYATNSLSHSVSNITTGGIYYFTVVTASSGQQPTYVDTSDLQYNQTNGQTILTSLSASSVTASLSGSLAGTATSASFAITASYVLGGPTIKAGILSASAFSGSPYSASVTFTTAFTNTIYSVVVTGEANRTFTITQKSGSRFFINSNSSTPMTGSTYWQAMSVGEYTY
jgi:hypothetical protein